MRIAFTWLAIICALSQPIPSTRPPTLDDALAVKSTGIIAAGPKGKFVAVEAEGGILVLSTAYPFTRAKELKGTHPSWSPDGSMLAFYANVDDKSQIAVWYQNLDLVQQITWLPEGISPNVRYNAYTGDSWAFAWSPNSKSIAFCSRRMVGFERLGEVESPNVRILATDTPQTQVMEGVFRTDYWDAWGYSNAESARMRAVERHPELGVNNLFIVDIQEKGLRPLSHADQYFYPSWSPDGEKVIALVDPDRIVDWEPGPQHTVLAIFDVKTGEEQRIPSPFPILGPPQWSSDGGEIVMEGRQRYMGFPHIALYFWKDRRWSTVATPDGHPALSIKWASDRRSLLVRTPNRFVNDLWLLNPETGKSKRIDTDDLLVGEFDQAPNGDIFFSASAVSFVGRVFMRERNPAVPLKRLYDPNPQFSDLRFGRQKRITWTNKAGDEVDGVLIFPPDYQASKRYPLLMDLYPAQGKDRFWLSAGTLGQIEASRGYVVLEPSFRTPHGPTFYTRGENYNEKARGVAGISILVDDFTSAVDYLVKQGVADPDRIGIFGHSNGGYEVNFLITETAIAKCAVVWSGASNLTYEQYFDPSWVREITNSGIYPEFKSVVGMSPLFRMNRVQAPLLMIVGDRDWDPWLPEMLMQFNALRQFGKDVTMVRYANEGHTFTKPENLRDFYDRVEAFFDRNLRKGQTGQKAGEEQGSPERAPRP